jgi:uncharacterized protein YcfJ
MKLHLMTLSMAMLLASGANAQGYDYARVLSAKPIYETVEVQDGREVCRNERVEYVEYRGGRRSESASVVGAIIGGVIGNQFGSGRGRTAATVAGAALGSAVARDAQNSPRNARGRSYGTERVCSYEPRYRTERELVGYDVRYDYKGQIGQTTTRNQPGSTIRVRVAVTPLED